MTKNDFDKTVDNLIKAMEELSKPKICPVLEETAKNQQEKSNDLEKLRDTREYKEFYSAVDKELDFLKTQDDEIGSTYETLIMGEPKDFLKTSKDTWSPHFMEQEILLIIKSRLEVVNTKCECGSDKTYGADRASHAHYCPRHALPYVKVWYKQDRDCEPGKIPKNMSSLGVSIPNSYKVKGTW